MTDEFLTIIKIVARAEKMEIDIGSHVTKILDMENARKQFHLRLDDMLAADDLDFAHDFTGIQASINRITGRIENCFVPRFAGMHWATMKEE